MNFMAKQTAALKSMLNLQTATDSKTSSNSAAKIDNMMWKVLVYDKYCEKIIAPLLSMSDLRGLGVTLNLLINKEREAIDDIPVVYFVQPTDENIDRIVADMAQGLYSTFHLNFSSSLPRTLLEKSAQKCLENGTVSKIAKVFDQFTQFNMVQDKFITLNLANSYLSLNDNTQADSTLTSYVDTVVESLFCIVATLGQVPIIRCRRGEAAEMIGQKLHQRLVEHLKSRTNLFTNKNNKETAFHRPLLVLVDRNLDLSVPLYHPWTYQALIHDMFHSKNNAVTVPVTENNNTQHTKYSLEDSDQFWAAHRGSVFPEVAQAIQTSLSNYQEELKAIDAMKNMDQLADTISALPMLQKQKVVLDNHTTIATSVSNQIKQRELDAYFAIETDMLAKGIFLDQAALVARLSVEGKGHPADKLRLFMIHFLCAGKMSDTDVDACKAALEASYGADESANQAEIQGLQFLKTHKFVTHIRKATSDQKKQSPSTGESNALGGIFGNLASKVYSQSSGLISGVRNLLPGKSDLPLTTVVDAFLNQKDTKENSEYLFLDPTNNRTNRNSNLAAPTYLNAMVCVLGGGNYTEYQNLQDFVTRQTQTSAKKSITYITTDVVTPAEFLQQFATLGATVV